MKQLLIVILCIGSVVLMQNCSSTKKAAAPNLSFDKDILPVMQASCTPCHFPPDGKKEPLNTYDAVKKNIADIITRVKLPKDNPKYMPFKSKKPALSDSVISVLEKWQAQNMPQ